MAKKYTKKEIMEKLNEAKLLIMMNMFANVENFAKHKGISTERAKDICLASVEEFTDIYPLFVKAFEEIL